jgi:hypothetical protein
MAKTKKVETEEVEQVVVDEVKVERVIIQSFLPFRNFFIIEGKEIGLPAQSEAEDYQRHQYESHETVGNLCVLDAALYEVLSRDRIFAELLKTSKVKLLEEMPTAYGASDKIAADAYVKVQAAEEKAATATADAEEKSKEIAALKAKLAALGVKD